MVSVVVICWRVICQVDLPSNIRTTRTCKLNFTKGMLKFFFSLKKKVFSLGFWEAQRYPDCDFQQCLYEAWITIDSLKDSLTSFIFALYILGWPSSPFRYSSKSTGFLFSTTCKLLDGPLCFWDSFKITSFQQNNRLKMFIQH